MLEFSNTVLENTIVHYIGAPGTSELQLSASCLDTSNELLNNLLRDYFLNNFKGNSGFYSFTHSTSLELNEMFTFSNDLFSGAKNFYDVSCSIAQHLKHSATHPNIKAGELYVVQLLGCVVDGEIADAIGVFKSENKERYLKTSRGSGALDVSCEFGVNPKRIDKACIIFNTEKDFGYKLCIIDNTNRDEAKYWVDDFLQASVRNDEFYKTKHAINLCKGFVQDVITPNNNHEKLEQADMLAKTKDFFRTNTVFEQDSFENNVIFEPEAIEAFREYKKSYEAEMGCEIPKDFTISADATKQANKYFKSCIKLDKNFHLYIHGMQERVEKGYDKSRNLNYYKLFFDNES